MSGCAESESDGNGGDGGDDDDDGVKFADMVAET